MELQVDVEREALARACRRHGVAHLSVFGSAVTDQFDTQRSDIDLLVDFLPEARTLDHYFGLKRELEELFGRAVDLVAPKALRNPYFARTVAKTRLDLYDAA